MEETVFSIRGIPAVLYGPPQNDVFLFVHGKQGCKEEAAAFAQLACPAGYQVVAVDLPEHGARQHMRDAFNPWTAVPELQMVLEYLREGWRSVSLRANSIGAYFSMLAFGAVALRQALFVSPIVDMERLIQDMMTWSGVTETQLKERGVIPTALGETLSWQYLTWVRQHPIAYWRSPTRILYGTKDSMTQEDTMQSFAEDMGAALTVVPDGPHWFHTPEECRILADWERASIAG